LEGEKRKKDETREREREKERRDGKLLSIWTREVRVPDFLNDVERREQSDGRIKEKTAEMSSSRVFPIS
jgi:hypothetical protein